MNHREPPHHAAGMHRALRCLSLLLLPALVQKDASGIPRSRPDSGRPAGSQEVEPVLLPYLCTLGAPPLRFQSLPPPPDLTARPAAAAPPVPFGVPADAISVSTEAKSQLTAVTAANNAAAEVPAPTDKVAPTKAPPPAIIPDDARPSIRPEDFLPYFQIPGTAKSPGDVNLLMPVPRGASASIPVPPSSATYTQSK